MQGIIGLNILGDRGLSRENVTAYVQRLKPAYCVVMNDPQQAAMLTGLTRVIYRQHGDDDAHRSTSPAAFVQERHAVAPPGAFIYLTNEPGRSDLQVLNQWTLSAIRECEQRGRKAVILNFATGNPEPGEWEALRSCVEAAKRGGHLLGLHEYFNRTVNASVPWHVGRYANARQTFGANCPPIVITELGCAPGYDPHKGWQGAYGEAEYAQELAVAAARYGRDGVGVCIFSYGNWQTYGIENAEGVKSSMVQINQTVNLPPVNPTPTPPPSVPTLPPDDAPGWVDKDASSTGNVTNVRAQPNTSSSVVGAIAARPTPVRLYPDGTDMADGKWNPVVVKATGKKGWVRSDVVKYADPAPPPDTPYLKLDVPYVSQEHAAEANRFKNDCGVACASMLLRYKFSRVGLGLPRLLTVNDMALKTSLVSNDDGLHLNEIVDLLAGYGVTAVTRRPLSTNDIVALLDAMQPVLVLVKYGHFNPNDSFKGGHFAVIVGYGERGFWCHDPYKAGADYYVTRETLDEAMRDVTEFASFRYQGVVLT